MKHVVREDGRVNIEVDGTMVSASRLVILKEGNLLTTREQRWK